VVYRDAASDIALLAVEDPSFFDGLQPLSRESLLPLLTAQAPEDAWPSPSGVDPFLATASPNDESSGVDRGSLALREWVRLRSSRGDTPSEGDASQYLPQALPDSPIARMAPPPSFTLADFTRSNEAGRFLRTNVTLAPVRNELGPAIRLSAPNAAADSVLILDNPSGWNLSGNGELVFSLKNNGPTPVTSTWTLVNAAGRRVSIQSFLGPGSYRNFRIPLVPATYTKAYTDNVLKSLRSASYLNNLAMDLTRIVRFQMTGRLGSSTIEIGNLVASGIPMPAQNPFPLVDEFGQYRFYGWDGKVTSVSDLGTQRERERLELAASPKPASWNEYGGWANGPLRAATGHFRTEKYNGKWYLVDPSGRLFFWVGVNEVHDRHETALGQRLHMFPPLPTISPDPYGIYTWLNSTHSFSYLAGAGSQCFSFFRHNLLQKYGSDWRNQFIAVTHQRLRSWGFNTLVNHGNPSYYQNKRFSYAVIVDTSFPLTIPGTGIAWGPFPDAYDARFSGHVASKLDAWGAFAFCKDDPWCIGIFVDNELPWAEYKSKENELGLGALSAPATQPAKIAFVRQLQGRYLTNIASLNRAWGTGFASWDQILATSVTLTTAQINNARPDLSIFFERTADTYFSKVRAVMQAKAPRKLYLGTRHSRMAGLALRSAARYCDVISLNFYEKSPLDLLNRTLPGNYPFRECVGDKPLLFSEFSFSALDRGLIYNNGIECIDEEERAYLFKRYTYDAMVEPSIVGVTYFQFVDQIVTGRSFDGEARIPGLIDNADQPHRHFVATVRQLSDAMYSIRSGLATGLPPYLPSRPDVAPAPSTPPPANQRRIVATSQGNGQVNLSVQSPPAAAVRYEWSVASAPAGSPAGVFSETAQTATVVQYTGGLYQYQVRFRDAGGALIESPVVSDPVDVRIGTDLVPVSVTPLTAKSGEVVTFSGVLRNIGSVASLHQPTAATFQVVPRAGGTPLVSCYGVARTSLAPGAQLNVISDQGGALGKGTWIAVRGQYTLRLIVDDVDRVPESNSANNVLTVDFDVTDSVPASPTSQPKIVVTPRPDGLVTLSVQNPPTGIGLTYDWSVVSAPAGAQSISFATQSQTTTAVHFTSGRYQYGVRIRNLLGGVVGSQVLSDPVNVNLLADLKPVSVSPLRAKPGELVGFTAVLQNIGSSAALQGQTAATFELLPKAGGARIPVGFGVKVTALAAGDTLSVPATHGGPLAIGKWIAVKGDYWLRVTADDIDRLPESNNANNVYTVDFRVE